MKRSRACFGLFVCLVVSALCQQLHPHASIDNLMDIGHWKRVRQIVEAELKTNPNDPRLLYYSSKVSASFNALDKALANAERAVSSAPKNPDYLAQLAEMHARLADRVSILKQVTYVRSLKKEVETALAVQPLHVDAMLVEIMFLSKAPLLAGGDRKRAHSLANDLTHANATWGNLIQARLAEQERDDPRIEHALTAAISASPSFYPAHFYLGKFYCCVSATRRLDAAEKEAREMIRLDASAAGGYDILARVAVLRGHWSELDAILAEAETKASEDFSPYYQAANLMIERGKEFSKAEQYLKKYLSQEPEGRQPTIQEGRQLLAFVTSKTHNAVEAGF